MANSRLGAQPIIPGVPLWNTRRIARSLRKSAHFISLQPRRARGKSRDVLKLVETQAFAAPENFGLPLNDHLESFRELPGRPLVMIKSYGDFDTR